MEQNLFVLQRLTALVMAPCVLVHLGVILYAVRGGLTVSAILQRTQGNWWWIAFYTLFVVSAGIHVPIGMRRILIEWGRMSRRAATAVCSAFALLLLFLGLRAVAAVGGVWS